MPKSQVDKARARLLLYGIWGFLGGIAAATFYRSWVLFAVSCFLALIAIAMTKVLCPYRNDMAKCGALSVVTAKAGIPLLSRHGRGCFTLSYPHWRKAIALLIGFAFGAGRFLLAMPDFNTSDLAFYRDLPKDLMVDGIVTTEVDARSDSQYLIISSLNLTYMDGVFPVRGKLLVKARRYPEFAYGDLVKINAKLVSPPIFDKFNYSDLLAKNDVFVTAYNPKIYLLERGHGEFFWTFVYKIKIFFSERINALYSEPEASLIAGLLLGLRKTIPQAVLNDFSSAGLTHILAISGYNVTLMITIFGLLFVRFSRKGRFWGMFSGIMLLVLFTGFSASVIRAGLMGFFVLLATLSGRKSNGLLMLFLSAFVMTMLNPRILISDLSFQLSFLATLGLILCLPFIEKYLQKLPDFLQNGLGVTLAAQVFTTPLILYKFGRFSLIAPIANVLFLPLIPAIMFFSFIGTVLSLIFWPLGAIFNAVAWIFLKIMLFGVHFVANLPFASLEI